MLGVRDRAARARRDDRARRGAARRHRRRRVEGHGRRGARVEGRAPLQAVDAASATSKSTSAAGRAPSNAPASAIDQATDNSPSLTDSLDTARRRIWFPTNNARAARVIADVSSIPRRRVSVAPQRLRTLCAQARASRPRPQRARGSNDVTFRRTFGPPFASVAGVEAKRGNDHGRSEAATRARLPHDPRRPAARARAVQRSGRVARADPPLSRAHVPLHHQSRGQVRRRALERRRQRDLRRHVLQPLARRHAQVARVRSDARRQARLVAGPARHQHRVRLSAADVAPPAARSTSTARPSARATGRRRSTRCSRKSAGAT